MALYTADYQWIPVDDGTIRYMGSPPSVVWPLPADVGDSTTTERGRAEGRERSVESLLVERKGRSVMIDG